MTKYTIEQAANILSLNARTLRRYNESGKFKALRHTTGRLYYTYEMLQDYLNGTYNPEDTDKYVILDKPAIAIEVNTNVLEKIAEMGDEDTSYYRITACDEYVSELNILRVKKPERKTETKVLFSIGKFDTQNNFMPVLSWKALEG